MTYSNPSVYMGTEGADEDTIMPDNRAQSKKYD